MSTISSTQTESVHNQVDAFFSAVKNHGGTCVRVNEVLSVWVYKPYHILAYASGNGWSCTFFQMGFTTEAHFEID